MVFAVPMQKIQDWFTQQWVILRGKRIDPKEVPWLIGPFGRAGGIGEAFIEHLAESEDLVVTRDGGMNGLIPSISRLALPEAELTRLSRRVIDFYENTARFDIAFSLEWNPFFRTLGILVNKLFSDRIDQLNIPTKNLEKAEPLVSRIITLAEPGTDLVKYTIWFRTIEASGQVIYSGAYGTCKLPTGRTCIKAVFPLPNGNATVLMVPTVGANGELILESSGKRFGDPGFYFLLKDAKGSIWSQFVRAFRDRLTIREVDDHIEAEQKLTLWHQKVLMFRYRIVPKEP